MKKTIMLLIMVFTSVNVVMSGQTAEQIMEQAYANGRAVSGIILKRESAKTVKDNIGKVKENVKKTAVSAAVKEPGQAAGNEPACYFDAENYFKNYVLSVKIKDERIKMGAEEITAIPKGQKIAYPQIRIIVKDKKIESMRFYDAKGNKSYEFKIDGYTKSKGAEYPARITEKYHTKTGITTIENSYILQ
ncbi:MAG TPA: hypothetical protein PLB12_04065 [Candidatus Goldiibacteriota bacterium]|nr:hypothetical protein [Candidatus Goldiibacteriota bacterium]